MAYHENIFAMRISNLRVWIYKVFEDPRIKMLENDIASWNDHCRYTDEEKHVMKQLLRRRSMCCMN